MKHAKVHTNHHYQKHNFAYCIALSTDVKVVELVPQRK